MVTLFNNEYVWKVGILRYLSRTGFIIKFNIGKRKGANLARLIHAALIHFDESCCHKYIEKPEMLKHSSTQMNPSNYLFKNK